MRPRLLSALIAALLLASACGEGQKVGNEDLLDFDEQKDAQALGREPDETEQPLSIGNPTPTPRPVVTQAPKAKPVFIDVELVTNSPYYKPGNCLVLDRVGLTLRVTNSDSIPERAKGRSFTDKGGTFHSGLLKPGETWTWVFDQPATYEVIDEGLNFANMTLHVGQGSCSS